MKEEKIEAIVLKSFDFKDRQKIITLFSQENGVMSMIVKGLSRKRPHLISLTSPLYELEILYTKGSSTLARLCDATILNPHFQLREQFSYLQLGMHFADIILRSQLPGKPSPSLYALFSSFLKQIPTFKKLEALTLSFYLKFLKHEGLSAFQGQCSHCEKQAFYLENGESLCQDHKKNSALFFSSDEWKTLFFLQNTTSFQTLRDCSIPKILFQKIENYFKEQNHN